MSKLRKVVGVGEVSKGVLKVEIEDKEILFVKDCKKIYALSNICFYKERELVSGLLDNVAWVCPHLRTRFNIIDGEVLSFPAVEGI